MATQAQYDAAFGALKRLELQDVPGWAQLLITDDRLIEIVHIVADNAERATASGTDPAAAAFAALEIYRATKLPFFAQGEADDNVLHTVVSTILAALK